MTINYGTDVKWDPVLGLQPGRTVTGPELVAQSVAIRLLTRRASALGAPNDGLDLRELLHAELTATELAQLPGQIRAEVLKDDRVRTCEVKLVPAGSSYNVSIAGVCSNAESFGLIVPVAELQAKDLT